MASPSRTKTRRFIAVSASVSFQANTLKPSSIAIQKIIVISGSQLYETIPDNLPA